MANSATKGGNLKPNKGMKIKPLAGGTDSQGKHGNMASKPGSMGMGHGSKGNEGKHYC